MHKVPIPDRADFSLGKEARHGDRAELFRHRGGIVVRPSEEALASTATAEHERAERGAIPAGPVCSKEGRQIFAGRVRVAEMKLDRLPFLHDIADRHGPRAAIRTEQVPNKKITPFKAIPMFVDHNAEMQRALPILFRQALEDGL